MIKKINNRFHYIVYLMMLCSISILNSCVTKYYHENNGKWILNEFPNYVFQPLDDSWEPLSPPTNNCAMFFGKIGGSTHIGVFLHSTPENFGPTDLMRTYLQNGPKDNKVLIMEPQLFGDKGVCAICVNEFMSYGAKVRAFEAYCIMPTSKNLIGFTFKSRIEVDSWDFRREKGQQVYENILRTFPEFEEFINFVKGFHEDYKSN